MATKAELLERLQELQLYNLRLEAANTDLRFRNGELCVVLQDLSEEAYDFTTPTKVVYSRHNRVLDLVETAIDWANTASPSKLQSIRETANSIQFFLSEHFDNRKKLTEEHIQAMQAGRNK